MFSFKQFAIRQERCAMKVGTDGVLLGAWAPECIAGGRILDIGTGTGVMAIMAAQRNPSARIVGVEIDDMSALQARENAEASPWADRVEIVNADIRSYEAAAPFDLVISNPPYFVDSLKSPDSGRTTARHTVSLDFGELMSAVERLLAPDGRFAVIVPAEAASRVVASGRLVLRRRCDVRSKPSAGPIRMMMEFAAGYCGAPEFSELTIGDGKGGYTAEYVALTRDFYLKF